MVEASSLIFIEKNTALLYHIVTEMFFLLEAEKHQAKSNSIGKTKSVNIFGSKKSFWQRISLNFHSFPAAPTIVALQMSLS